MPSALIVGCGLAGSLLARLLAQDGWKVDVFERRSDPRAKGYAGGRSINLALSARGLKGLAAAGLDGRVMANDAIAMRARMMHSVRGDLTAQPYSSNASEAINSVSRGGLNITLLNAAAELPGVGLHFDQTCIDIDVNRCEAVFRGPDGRESRVTADLILGADGAFSPVRMALQKTDRFEYQQSYLGHGYKELHIPPAAELLAKGVSLPHQHGLHAMDPHALHIWPRGSSMMIALPNRDGSFTCTLFWPFDGNHSFASLRSDDDVRTWFDAHYADAVSLLPELLSDYRRNPVGSLITVRCFPWVAAGRVAILGDAAHAIVPFYGQGMNAAFEDCVTLVEQLRASGGDHAAALDEFQRIRKPNAEAIADMAIDNFVEMRDKVGNSAFLYKKRIEQALHQLEPDELVPQYNLVSFSTKPYVEARAQGHRLNNLYERIIARVPREMAAVLSQDSWRAKVKEALDAERRIGESARETAHLGKMHDISPAITSQTQVWPGDTPLSREIVCDMKQGANITLSAIRSTVHLGSHADGPNHYGRDARSVGEQPLDLYIGECQVIEVSVAKGGRVAISDIPGGLAAVTSRRVLLKTSTFPDFAAWNEDFAAISPELVDALASKGVVTVGIDTPSVDVQNSKDLPAHQAFLRRDIAILEGLDLRSVSPGHYLLMAQPLKLLGFDASPIRAVLADLPAKADL